MTEQMIRKMLDGIQCRAMANMAPAEDEEQYIVEGYATTFNEPYVLYRYGDVTVQEQIDHDAFADCDATDVIMQFDHNGRVFARTSNNTLTLTVDFHGLKIRADLSGTEAGRQLYEEIKGGYVTKMSFRFHVSGDSETRTEADGKVTYLRTITAIDKLYDVSAVSIPANDATEISARSYYDSLIEREAAERRKREQREERIHSLHHLNKEE